MASRRMAAFNTIDAVRAAEFWLYFPNQRLTDGTRTVRLHKVRIKLMLANNKQKGYVLTHRRNQRCLGFWKGIVAWRPAQSKLLSWSTRTDPRPYPP
jgi:hypothetical protein